MAKTWKDYYDEQAKQTPYQDSLKGKGGLKTPTQQAASEYEATYQRYLEAFTGAAGRVEQAGKYKYYDPKVAGQDNANLMVNSVENAMQIMNNRERNIPDFAEGNQGMLQSNIDLLKGVASARDYYKQFDSEADFHRTINDSRVPNLNTPAGTPRKPLSYEEWVKSLTSEKPTAAQTAAQATRGAPGSRGILPSEGTAPRGTVFGQYDEQGNVRQHPAIKAEELKAKTAAPWAEDYFNRKQTEQHTAAVNLKAPMNAHVMVQDIDHQIEYLNDEYTREGDIANRNSLGSINQDVMNAPEPVEWESPEVQSRISAGEAARKRAEDAKANIAILEQKRDTYKLYIQETDLNKKYSYIDKTADFKEKSKYDPDPMAGKDPQYDLARQWSAAEAEWMADPEHTVGSLGLGGRVGDLGATPAEKNLNQFVYWMANGDMDSAMAAGWSNREGELDLEAAKYQGMTDSDRARFNYLYKDDPRAALAFLEEYADIFNVRRIEAQQEKDAKYAAEKPVAAWIESVGRGIMQPAYSFGELLATIGGASKNDPMHDFTRSTQTISSVADEQFNKAFVGKDGKPLVIPIINKPLGSFLAGAGRSIVNSYGLRVFGKLFDSRAAVNILLSSQVLGPALVEGLDKGLNNGQASILAIAKSFIEYGTEKYSTDAFFDKQSTFWKQFGVSAFTEGTEETAATIGGTIADAFISGSKTDVQLRINAILDASPHMSVADATKQARTEWLQDLGADTLAGVLSGGVFGAGTGAQSASQNRTAGKNLASKPGSQEALTSYVKQNLDPESAARGLIAKYTTDEKKMTYRQAGEVANVALQELMEQFQGAKTPAEKIRIADMAKAVEGIIGDINKRPATAKTIKETAEQIALSPEAAEQLKTDFDASKLDEATFSDAYTRAYQAGLEGIDPAYLTSSTAVAKLSPDLAKTAYDLGTKNFASEMRGQKMEAAAAAKLTKLKPGEGGVTYHASVDKAKLRPYQQNQINIWDTVAKVLGLNAVMFQSATDAQGNIVAGTEFGMENGKYEYSTGRIWIDVNAQKKNVKDSVQAIILKTAGHEVTHFIKHLSPVLYREYSRAVTQALANAGQDLDTLIDEQIARSAKGSAGGIDFGVALEEVIANQSDLMLRDSKVITDLQEKSPDLFNRIREWLVDFSKRVRDAFERFRGTESASQKAIMQDVEGALRYTDELIAKFDIALGDAAGIAPVAPSAGQAAAPATVTMTMPSMQETAKEVAAPSTLSIIREGIADAKAKEDAGVRFQMRSPVEETAKLIAVHNLNEAQLLSSVELGGFAMPSIAVIKAGQPHDRYGDISIVFGKETIDPENYGNKVYGGDAWTPSFPEIQYEVGYDEVDALRKKVKAVVGEELYRILNSPFDEDNLQQEANRNRGDFGEAFQRHPLLIAAYLKSNGEKANIVKTAPTFSDSFDNENVDLIDKEMGDRLIDAYNAELDDLMALEPEVRSIINNDWAAKHVTDDTPEWRKILYKNPFSYPKMDGLAAGIIKKRNWDGEAKVDRYETERELVKQISGDKEKAAYKSWVNGLFNGVIVNKGIRNNADIFTPSGNRRSFSATHWAVTLENVVRAMRSQEGKGSDSWGSSGLFGVSTKNYNSLSDIRKDIGRLRQMDEEQYQAKKDEFQNRIVELAGEIAPPSERNRFIALDNAAEVLTEAARKGTTAGIQRVLNGYKDYYNIREDTAKKLYKLMSDISRMPTEYFEAKPERAVGFGEVRAVIIPDTASDELKKALDNMSATVIEYKAEDDADRLKALNSPELDGVRFQERDPVPPMYSKMEQEISAYKGNKVDAGSFVKYLTGRGVKADEIRWSGVQTFLQGKKSVTKAELLEFARGNALKVVDVASEDRSIRAIQGTSNEDEFMNISWDSASEQYVDTVNRVSLGKAWDDVLEYARSKEQEMKNYWQSDDARSMNLDQYGFDETTDADEINRVNDYYDRWATNDAVFVNYPESDSRNKPKFDEYILGSGTNYREILFTVPDLDGTFQSAHWDEKNVLAHTRMQDFTTKDGKPVLFIEEVQSDWHEKGREKGYYRDLTEEEGREFDALSKEYTSIVGENRTRASVNDPSYAAEKAWEKTDAGKRFKELWDIKYSKEGVTDQLVPPAPFTTTWHEYVLKRALRMAAEDGYDYMAWTTGAMQNDRYSLAKHVDRISVGKTGGGKYLVTIYDKSNRNVFEEENVTPSRLSEVIGKEAARNVIEQAEKSNALFTVVPGDGLMLGGKGMRNFYDIGGKSSQNIPRYLSKYGAQWGAGISTIEIQGDKTYSVPAIEINERMKESVLYEGQTLYQERDSTGAQLTQEQAAFFRDSKVRDESGQLIPVYHGSKSKGFNTFIPSYHGNLGAGVYLTTKKYHAENYSGNGELFELYANIKKPMALDDYGFLPDKYRSLGQDAKVTEALQADGYDGIIAPNGTVVAFSSEQIKRTSNLAPTTNPDIRFQERTDDPSSAREILSTGFEAIAANDAERSLLKTYQGRVKELNAMEQAVTGYRTQIQAIESSIGFDPKAPNDRLIRLKNNVKTLTDKINRADKKLLTFEKAAPLKNVLDREVKKVQEKQAQIRRVQLEQYRNNRATTDSKRKLRDQIIRGVKKVNDLLVNESDKRHIPEGLKSVVIEFMQPFLQDTSVFYRDQLNRLRDVYDAIGRGEHEGEADLQRFFDEELAADLRDMALTLDGRRLSQLTEAELQTVLNIVGNLDHMIIYENAVEIAGRREEISTLSEAVKDEHRGKAKDKRVALLTGNNPVAMIVKMLSSQNIKPVYFFKTLGGTMKRLFDDIRRSGQSRYGLTLKTSRDYFIDIATRRHYWDWNNKQGDTLRLRTAIGDEIELTREQALSLYAISKREKTNIQQKASHLKEGGFVFTDAVQVTEYHKGIPVKYTVNTAETHPLNETDVEQVNAWLTDEQRAFADDMVAYLSTEMADLGNEASMKLYGIRKYLEKYYFPYKSSENFLYRQQGRGAVEGMQNALIHRGFTKRTVQFANNPIVLDDFTKVWGGHVESMVMYNSMVMPLENFNRVYNYKTRSDIAQGIKPESVKSVLESAYGRKATEYIEQLIDDLNGGVRPPKAEALTDKMIGLFKRGAVFANLSVVVQQPSAIMRAMALIDPKHFLSAFYTKADNAEMLKYSGVAVLKEMGRFDVGLGMGSAEWLTRQDRKQMNVAQAMADKDVRDDTLAYLPRRADEITWTSIWRAVKNEVAAEGKLQRGTPEFMAAVTERFEDVIDYTQVYDSVLARSEMMRAKSGMMKSITAFMSEPTTSYNMLYDAFANRKDKGAKDHVAPARAMAAFTASIILNSLLKALVMAMRDDDEDKTYVEKYINSAAEGIIDGMNPVGMVPIFRDILSIVQGYDVNRADMALITDLYRALDKANNDRYTAMDKIEGIAGAVAAFLGVPVKNVWRDGKGIYSLITSKMPISATTGAGVKNALMEALPGYNTSLNAYYRRLYDAINDGYMNKQAELTEILMRKGKEQKTIDAGLRKLAREAALEGSITPSKAMEQLKRFGVDSVTADVRDLYDANVITQDEAVRLLEQYGTEKMDAPDERYKIITRWNHERTVPEGEDSDYKVMDNFLEAVKTGKNLRNVVTDYMDPKKYGYSKSYLAGQITEAYKPKYIALMKTDRKAATSLQGYLLNAYVMLGYDRDDRKKAIDKWLKP